MKVIEKATERGAEMHLHVQSKTESINPLDEYGEYVDVDGAVCCFVPVTEGGLLKAEGRFKGIV